MNIYVGNLSRQTTEDDLRQAFEAFGQVESISIVKDRFSGDPINNQFRIGNNGKIVLISEPATLLLLGLGGLALLRKRS